MKTLDAAALALFMATTTCGEDPKVERMSEQTAHRIINVMVSLPYPPDCRELADKSIDALDEFEPELIAPNAAALKDGTIITVNSVRVREHIRQVILEIDDPVEGGFNGALLSHCYDK